MNHRHFPTLQASALALALLGLATASAASAQTAQPAGNGTVSFQSLDKNGDGHLSRSEIPSDMPLLRTRLTTYDANHDGVLDQHEFATAEMALEGGGHAGSSDNPSPPRPRATNEGQEGHQGQ